MIPILVFVILALAAGLVLGYFFYRMRHNRALGLFEARETALSHRESEYERVHTLYDGGDSERSRELSTLESTVQILREELEEKSMEIGFLKEEHRLEQKVLLHEIESLKTGKGRPKGFRYEIEDVRFKVSPSRSDDPDSEKAPLPLGTADGTENLQSDGTENLQSDSTENLQADSTENPQADGTENLQADLVGDIRASTSEEPVPNQRDGTSTPPDKRENVSPKTAQRTTTDWASDVVSYLFSDLISTFSDNPARQQTDKSDELPDVDDHDAAPDAEIRSIPYPKFKTLYELRLFDVPGNPANERNGAESPTVPAEQAGLQLLLGLSDSDFSALQDMGFATYERVAQLSDSEIEMLSERFGVPPARIVSIWISGAQLRLHQDA